MTATILVLAVIVAQRLQIKRLNDQALGYRRAIAQLQKTIDEKNAQLRRLAEPALARALGETRAGEKNAHIDGRFLRKDSRRTS